MKKKRKIYYSIIIGILIVSIGITSYIFQVQIIEFISNRTIKTVDKALNHFKETRFSIDKESSGDFLSLFTEEYKSKFFYPSYLSKWQNGEFEIDQIDQLEFRPRVFISDWKLKRIRNFDGSYTIYVDIISKHNKSKRKIDFVLVKNGRDWLIKDSHNFLIVDALQDEVNKNKSDIEKYNILEGLYDDIEIEISDLEFVINPIFLVRYQIKCIATIKNNSNIPIYYARLRMNFKDNRVYNDDSFHIYEDMIKESEVLQPDSSKSIVVNELHSGESIRPAKITDFSYGYRLILEGGH